MEKKFGYARVSTKEQNEARQMAVLREAGIAERDIFLDKESGKNFDRTAYKQLLIALREGDELYIPSLDRLGRNYDEISAQWETITHEIGAEIIIMDCPLLDTRRKDKDLTGQFIADITLKLLSYVAELERRNIRTRQRAGIDAAIAAGVYKGSKPLDIDKGEFEEMLAKVQARKLTVSEAAEKLGIKRATWYKVLKEYEGRTGRFAE